MGPLIFCFDGNADMILFQRLLPLSVLALLGGCASTQQAAVEAPAATVASTPVPMAAPEPVVAATAPKASLVVTDLTSVAVNAPTPPEAVSGVFAPHPCMQAWTQGMQLAFAPWAQVAQSCDIRVPTP